MSSWLEDHRRKQRQIALSQKISNVNWPIVRDDIYQYLQHFLNEHANYLSDFRIEINDCNCGDSGVTGFESLQIIQSNKYLNVVQWVTTSEGVKYAHFKDYGVLLDIMHSPLGLTQVFLKRQQSEMTSNIPPKLLLYFTDDPLDLTDKRILNLFKVAVFYSRATSVVRRLTLSDKAYLLWLETRSKMRYLSLSSYLFDTIFRTAFLTLAIAVITLYYTYLGVTCK